MQLKVGNMLFDITKQPVKNNQLFLTSNRNIFCQGVFQNKWNLKPTVATAQIQQKISAKKVSSLDLKGIKLTQAKEDPELQARREVEKQAQKLTKKQEKKLKEIERESEPTDSIKEMKKESRKRKTFTEEDEKKINAAKNSIGTVTKRRKGPEEELSLSEDYLEREEDEEEEEGDDDEDEDYKE